MIKRDNRWSELIEVRTSNEPQRHAECLFNSLGILFIIVAGHCRLAARALFGCTGLCLGAQGFARACQARKAHTDFGNLGARERQVNPSRNNSSKGLINIGSRDRSPVIECTGSMRLSVQFVFAELTASCHLIDEGSYWSGKESSSALARLGAVDSFPPTE